MFQEHVIGDELLAIAHASFRRNQSWVAYNEVPYFLDKGDMYFFSKEDEADEFAYNNVSEYDHYQVIYARSVDELLRQVVYGGKLEDYLHQKLPIMNEQNFDYLKGNVRNLGFGETLAPELEAQLRKGAPAFTLPHKTEINKHEVEATLHFRKSDKSDMYFLNKYDLRLKNEKDETMAQTFYLNNGWGVTLKEGYNLLNGRAVHKELSDKEGEKYMAWIQLDFSVKDKQGNYERKPYYANYGYDLREALSYFNVKEMRNDEDAKKLLRSLERGNVQSATIIGVDKNVKVFLEANPKYKTVTLYNEHMKLIGKEQRQELMIRPDGKEMKQSAEMQQGDGKKQTAGKEQTVAREQGEKKQQGDPKLQSDATEQRADKSTSVDKGQGVEQQQSAAKSLGAEDQPGKKSAKARTNDADTNGMVTKKRERSNNKGLSV